MSRSGFQYADSPLGHRRVELKVSRPVVACQECRRMKVKCDQNIPACGGCVRNHKEEECVRSADSAFVRERSYLIALQNSIKDLEEKIKNLQDRNARTHGNGMNSDRRQSAIPVTAPVNKIAQQRETNDIDDLVSDFGSMAIKATFTDSDKPSSLTFSRLIMITATADKEKMIVPKLEVLLPESSARDLIQYYLAHVHTFYPVFEETTLWTAFNVIYSIHRRQASNYQRWLFFMVLGIGATTQSRRKNDAFYKTGVQCVGCALRYVDEVLTPEAVTQLPALALFVIYSMLDPAHFDCWQLIGYACRSLVELGYHQDPPKDHLPKAAILDGRRRLFYCIYSLDRAISMMTSRPFSFTDDATAVQLPRPSPETKWLTMGSSQAALSLFQLRRIQSLWYQKLHINLQCDTDDNEAYGMKQCHDMLALCNASSVKSAPLQFQQFFKLELLYSYIYCLTPSNPATIPSPNRTNLILRCSMEYVERFHAICQDPVSLGYYTYVDVRRLYFVGHHFLKLLDTPETMGRVKKGELPNNLSPCSFCPNLKLKGVPGLIKTCKMIQETFHDQSQRWVQLEDFTTLFETTARPIVSVLQALAANSHRTQHTTHANLQDSHEDVPRRPLPAGRYSSHGSVSQAFPSSSYDGSPRPSQLSPYNSSDNVQQVKEFSPRNSYSPQAPSHSSYDRNRRSTSAQLSPYDSADKIQHAPQLSPRDSYNGTQLVHSNSFDSHGNASQYSSQAGPQDNNYGYFEGVSQQVTSHERYGTVPQIIGTLDTATHQPAQLTSHGSYHSTQQLARHSSYGP